MSDLLPINASPAERDVDAASTRLDELEVPARHLWSPALCPLELLPWLAWALGVETWNADWPASLKRQACAEAFEAHREKGTAAALRRILGLIGAVYEYVEGPAGGLDPLTAKVTILNSESIELDSLDDIKAALGRAKRASVQLQVEIGTGFRAAAHGRAGFGTLQAIRFGSEGAAA